MMKVELERQKLELESMLAVSIAAGGSCTGALHKEKDWHCCSLLGVMMKFDVMAAVGAESLVPQDTAN